MFNNINQVDESFIEDNMELFYYPCEECKDKDEEGKEKCKECGGEGQHEAEAYQYFAVGVSDWDIKRLKEYGVEVGYSELCDLHILPIYNFGTSWSAFSYSKEVDADYQLSHDETLKRETVY